jgi:hypothetical protein
MTYGVKIMKIRAIENLTKANFVKEKTNKRPVTHEENVCLLLLPGGGGGDQLWGEGDGH